MALVDASQSRGEGEAPALPRSDAGLAGLRVFLADDDLDLLCVVASVLRRAGCEVIEAVDGDSLLRLLGKAALWTTAVDCPFDVIVTDIQMPRPTGLELLAGLRRGTCTTPVILMTADINPRVARRAVTLGALRLLPKPLDLAELERVLAAELAAVTTRQRGDNAPHSGRDDGDERACSECGAMRNLHPYGAAALCRDCLGSDPWFRLPDFCDLGGEG